MSHKGDHPIRTLKKLLISIEWELNVVSHYSHLWLAVLILLQTKIWKNKLFEEKKE